MKDTPSPGAPRRRRRAVVIGLVVVVLLCATAAVVGCFAFGLFDSIFFPNKGAYQPAVVVRASYPGANAQMVADTVAAPIEQQVNGVEGMVNMTSRCTSDGDYELTVIFKPGSDLNLSQVLVQNRVSLAEPVLP